LEATKAPEVTPAAARRFLKALSDGVPPHSALTGWLTVGQENILSAFRGDLSAVAGGDSRSLLLLGNPGAGKSQLLITLQYLAIRQGFVTAYFSQDVQSRLAFNRPDQVYRRIIETMRLPEDPNGIEDPLRKIMDEWVDRALPKLQGTNRSMAIAFKLAEIGFLPAKLEGVHHRTSTALVGYVMATEQQSEDARVQFLSVLRGPGLTNSRLLEVGKSVNLERRGFIGYTPNVYDAGYYFGQLGTLIFIMRFLGYKGMATLFDEVTAIVDLGARSREKAYKVLDSLFFNDYGYKGVYAVFAYMPALINQLRDDRLQMGKDYVERWSTLWDQRMHELEPLGQAEITELLRRLSYLHGVARQWAAWSMVSADALALIKTYRGNGMGTRELVKKGLDLLDRRNAES
jgi:hypothetical protein